MKRRTTFSRYRERFPSDAAARAARDEFLRNLLNSKAVVLKVFDEPLTNNGFHRERGDRVYGVIWEELQ